MKRVLLITMSAAVIFMACNSETVQKKNESSNEAKVKSMATPVDPVAQKMEALKHLTPVGLEELSAWLPAALNDIKRSNLTMSSDMGYAVAHADYEKNNATNIRVTAYDCGGATGAGLYKTTYADKLNEAQETEEAYTKTIAFMGGQAIEHHEKKNKVTTLTYMANNRILIVLSARSFEPEKVRQAAQQLHAN